MTALVEGACEESEHLLQGRHAGQAPQIDGRVLINDGDAPAGALVEVEITEAFADDLVGHIVGAAGVRDAERVTAAAAVLA
jgi:ribosomal protein S12 methylthiotransferase